MAKYKVYITDYDYEDIEIEKNILEPIGAELIGLHCKDGKGIIDNAKDADALIVQYATINREIFNNLDNLKIVARYGVGMDIVDTKAAKEKGVICTNVSNYCNDEVADHNVAFILMLARRIPMFVSQTKKNHWHWSETGRSVHRFKNMQIGIIGLGRIAQNMVKKIQAFGFSIVANDPFLDENYMKSVGVKSVDFEFLLETSDIVVLQCPYTKETHHIVGEKELVLMKSGSILINCSRGKLVDNDALYYALKSGHLASAGLDDLEDEPAKMFGWSAKDNKLFSLDNCFITPHVAYYSKESLIEARTIASNNVKAVLLGEEPPNKIV